MKEIGNYIIYILSKLTQKGNTYKKSTVKNLCRYLNHFGQAIKLEYGKKHTYKGRLGELKNEIIYQY